MIPMVLFVPALIGGAGMVVDVGQVYIAQNRLQGAVDAAALAGSMQLPYDPDMEVGKVEQAATNLMTENYPSATIVEIVPGGNVRSVCVKAEVAVDLDLMPVLGVDQKIVTASACAGFNNLEIAFVIDSTGSMKGTPMDKTKQAALDLTDLVLPTGGSAAAKVGLVPFRGKVHLPGGYDGLPEGCRNVDGSLDEGFLDEYKDKKYRYPKNSWLRVDDDTCSGISLTHALTTEKSQITQAISALSAYGVASGTVISEGVKWGRHVLTPEAPFTEGSEDDKYRKIMIILTDGDTEDGECGGRFAVGYTPSNYWTNAYYGAGETESHCDNGGVLNQALLDEASLAKNEEIEIFSIRYGTSDSVDIDLMKSIASSKPDTDDHYFNAPSTSDIDDVFKHIGQQLGLRILPAAEAGYTG
ncbi:vWA domain-containing protein [Desulfovibrio inopinatus]|uniref:vWA domain-containing protein n=1 Tax=Desulfovibrio inopinatus TaxID=102109 RepID=UPI00041001D9|nr:TadE/TadG family type IV pilus assembly protein [Desulfovibrio inopinatus]